MNGARSAVRREGVAFERFIRTEEQEDAASRPVEEAATRLVAHQAQSQDVRVEVPRLDLVGKIEHRLENSGQAGPGLGHDSLLRAAKSYAQRLAPARPGSRFPSPSKPCKVFVLINEVSGEARDLKARLVCRAAIYGSAGSRLRPGEAPASRRSVDSRLRRGFVPRRGAGHGGPAQGAVPEDGRRHRSGDGEKP